ncbi:hypothetical protein [Ammoniphilus sp. YIM 78166]|nr:hypothetical protein [Ammoniphilus sp. YIM 78166]
MYYTPVDMQLWMTYVGDQDEFYFPYFEHGIESFLMVAEPSLYSITY